MNADAYVLGVDPGVTCGFAVLRMDETRVVSGSWRLHSRVGQGDGGRFVNLHDHLASIVRTFPTIVSIAYEVPGHLRLADGRGASTATYLGLYGIVAHVESWAERHSMHYCGFSPQEAKQAAGVAGNAKKYAVTAAIVSRYAIDVCDSHECDAIAIAVAGVHAIKHQQLKGATTA